jgi:hypothetical protein
MALTYPLSLPSFALFETCSFRFVQDVSQVRTQGAIGMGVQRSQGYWTAEYTTTKNYYVQQNSTHFMRQWEGWWAAVTSGDQSFYATDPAWRGPQAYVGGAFPDTTGTWVSSSGRTVTISGLAANYQAKAGDLIEILSSVGTGNYTLLRIAEDAVANVSGQLVVDVDRAPPFAVSTVTNRVRLGTELRVLMQPVIGSDKWDDNGHIRAFSFSAQETRRP